MFEYLIYLGAEFLASVFSLRQLYWIARRIADLHHFFDRRGRAAVKDNLRVITGGRLDKNAIDKAVKQTYYHFSLYLAEFFRMKKLDRGYFDSHVKIVGIENVDIALKHGNGAIVVSAHYSNWELGLAALAMTGYQPYVIAAPHKNRKVNELFLRPRIKAGARPIFTENAIDGGYKALRSNGILILLGDRVTTKGGVETTFFGRTAVFPKGPAKFALRASAPLISAYIMRQPGNTFVLTFEEPIYTDDMPDDDESLRRLMSAYARRFETYISRDPTQYGVFYKIWKNANNQVRNVSNQNSI
jgi:KDO2-lipid IV(A) lauroyltransferase